MINLNNKNRNLQKISFYFYSRIKTNINDKIDNNIGFLNQYKTDDSLTPLGDYLKNNIIELITFPLDSLLNKYPIEFERLFSKEYVTQNKVDSKFKKIINKILFYEDQDSWQAYQLSIDIGVNTCAYCNRTYITTLGNDENKFTRGDFDHFLPKSKYPYFRLSFFNLIPCCIICNRNAKRAHKTSLENNIYPFTEGFDNKTIFTYLPKSYDELIGKGKPEINFLYLGDNKHKHKSKGNVNLFRLVEQYSTHTQELNDLIIKRRIFSESYLKELQINFPGLIHNFEEAYHLAFGKEWSLILHENRPLSKFTRDIVNELEFLNI